MTPQSQIATKIISFLRTTYAATGKHTGVIAVSGGIDSAVSLTLLTQALGPEHVHALLLPYADQSIADSQEICTWNDIPESNVHTIAITQGVDALTKTLGVTDQRRAGNIMARVRMIMVYDTAMHLDALVCGTENRSEHYLGYYTRFGDEASDVEPLRNLSKTNVRMLAQDLELPSQFLIKAPSAGLWDGQTDEQELGFSYEDADTVIAEMLGECPKDPTLGETTREKILTHIHRVAYKHDVPYLP